MIAYDAILSLSARPQIHSAIGKQNTAHRANMPNVVRLTCISHQNVLQASKAIILVRDADPTLLPVRFIPLMQIIVLQYLIDRQGHKIVWVHSLQAGVDNLIENLMRLNASVPLTNAKGAFSWSLAEYVLTAILVRYILTLFHISSSTLTSKFQGWRKTDAITNGRSSL